MRWWLGLVVVSWSANAVADDVAFSRAPLVGAVHGAAALPVDDGPPPPPRTAIMTDRNKEQIDRIIAADGAQLGDFKSMRGDGGGTGTARVGDDASKPQPKVAVQSGSGDFGGLTSEEIDRVIRARAGVIRACYQKELVRTKNLAGKIVVSFRIDAAGAVTKASVASTTMKSSAVEGCVVAQVKKLKFPSKGGIANVSYPFVFTQG